MNRSIKNDVVITEPIKIINIFSPNDTVDNFSVGLSNLTLTVNSYQNKVWFHKQQTIVYDEYADKFYVIDNQDSYYITFRTVWGTDNVIMLITKNKHNELLAVPLTFYDYYIFNSLGWDKFIFTIQNIVFD